MLKNKPLIWGLGASLVMLVAAIIVGVMTPNQPQLPIHWNASGDADHYAGKWVALLIHPAMAVFTTILVFIAARADPRRKNIVRSQAFINMTLGASVALFALLQLIVSSIALGMSPPTLRIIFVALAGLFAVIANYFAKTRPNFFFGIRTPWTLSNEEVWIKTHRLGGYTFMVLAGMLFFAGVMDLHGQMVRNAIIGGTICAALIPIVYSYFLWNKIEKQEL